MAPLFAAPADVAKVVVALLFFLVWVVSAIVKSANEQKERTQPPLPRPDNAPAAAPARPRIATAAERAEFLRKQQQPQQTAPRKATPVAVARPIPALPVATERRSRLHSEIEDRHTADLHSRLEQQHLEAHAVRGKQMTLRGPSPYVAAGARGAAQGKVLASMLSDRRNLAMALMLGQALLPPAAAGGGTPAASDPLGLPPSPR